MAKIEPLRELNQLDQQIRGLRRRLDAALRRRDAQQRRFDQLNLQRQELETQLKQVQAQANSLESEAGEIDDRVEKIRQRMNSVTSNKEYSALLVEMNTLKVDKGKKEEQALAFMNDLEELKPRLDEVRQELETQQKLLEGAENEVVEARDEIGDRLNELEQQRKELAGRIEGGTLAMYERLVEDTDGEALAEIEEQDRRRMEYTCGACFMSLPIEVVNVVLSKPDETVICPNCRRILYAPQELRQAISSK